MVYFVLLCTVIIKPSNFSWDEQTEQVSLIDWGSCCVLRIDPSGQTITTNRDGFECL